VTDGPFVESKEVIGGFAILEAKSKEDAIRLAKEFLAVAGDGECEIRQIFTAADGLDCSGVHQELVGQFAGRNGASGVGHVSHADVVGLQNLD
jgi:hypothetical protein